MKFVFSLVLIFLVSCFFVSSAPLEIDLVKDDYASGETLQAEIIIDSIEEELSTSNIKLVDDALSNIGITPFLIDTGDNYYVYFQIPADLELGNYSLVVEDVVYYNGDLLIRGDFSEDFSIVEKENVISVDPGFIKADDLGEQNSFDVYLSNKKDENVEVSFSADADFISLSDSSIDLVDDYTLEVYISEFLIDDYSTKYLSVEYGDESYEVPIWLGGGEAEDPLVNDTNVTENQTIVEEGKNVMFLVEDDLEFSFRSDESRYVSIEFQNIGNVTMEDIWFDLEGDITEVAGIKFLLFEDLSPGEIGKQEIYLNAEENALGLYSGKLILTSGNDTDEVEIFVNFFEETVVDIPDNPIGDGFEFGNLSDVEPEDDEEKPFPIIWIIVLAVFVLAVIIVYSMYAKHQKKRQLNLPFFR